MWLRLRQICLVVEKLAPLEEALYDILRVKVAYRDPGIVKFGLENALFPVGNQLLEVVAPIEENTAAGRYLDRRGGDSGYMFITQCDDHAPRRARVESLGIRIVYEFERPEFRNMQLHPKDTGGTFFEINEQLGPHAHAPDGPWHPAGPDWKAARALNRVTGIAAAEIQCEDPAAVAECWSEIAEIALTGECGHPTALPAPYSPDFNPIELMWSKVKASLRSANARTTLLRHHSSARADNLQRHPGVFSTLQRRHN